MTSAIEVRVAALRAAQVTCDDALQIALYMVDPDKANKPEIARTLGYSAYDTKPAERLELAAAALILAAEYERLTPFEKWFQRHYTKDERKKLSQSDIKHLKIGYEAVR